MASETETLPEEPVTAGPRSLDEFVGQADMRRTLQMSVYAARQRGATLDHTLFYGPPGLGKTTLAHVTAHEMGVGFRAVSAPTVERPADIVGVLLKLQPQDVLFIDEIHRLQRVHEEILYTAMEEYKVNCALGEGTNAESVTLDLNPFTLIGATTRLGQLDKPFRDRFGIHLKLQLYGTEELQEVLRRAAPQLDVDPSEGAFEEIAKRSRGTPRIAKRLLKRVRDYAAWVQAAGIDDRLAHNALRQLGIDEDGLDETDRRYIEILNEEFRGGPVGLKTLATSLHEDTVTVEELVEPYLIQRGYVQRTHRGRVAPNDPEAAGTLL